MTKFVEDLTRDEISLMYSLLKVRVRELDTDAVLDGKLKRGAKVQFKSSKKRFGFRMIVGVVTSISGRKVELNCGMDDNWKVPASMLEVVR